MCDRVTQLQDHINQLAEHMCNAIGILQQTASPSPPSSMQGSERLLSVYVKKDNGDIQPDDYPPLFATLISRAARDVDYLIDQLPADDLNLDQQITAIKKIDSQNRDAVKGLAGAVKKGQDLMTLIQSALSDIADAEIAIRKLDL